MGLFWTWLGSKSRDKRPCKRDQGEVWDEKEGHATGAGQRQPRAREPTWQDVLGFGDAGTSSAGDLHATSPLWPPGVSTGV